MENIGIILCSTVSKTEQILNDENVHYISLTTNFSNFEIKSGEVTLSEYFAKVEVENEVPSTSQPSTGDIITKIEEVASKYDKLLIVTISEMLSGTHQNVVLAISDLEPSIQEKIQIVNSNCIAMTETMVYDEFQKQKDTLEFDDLVKHLRNYAKGFKTYAVPGSMKFLKMSGRVNTSQLVLGTLANIKTLIKADSESVTLFHKGRGYKSIFKKLDEELTIYKPKLAYYSSILEEEKIHQAMLDLFAKHNVTVIETMEADIVAGTHFGPNSFGFTILAENNK